MSKRKRTTSTINSLSHDIKIKVEKDYEEEESLVTQNFQPIACFDEGNQVKREVELIIEEIVKLEPEDFQLNEEFEEQKSEICEKFSVLRDVFVKITKDDISVAEPFAKKLKIDNLLSKTDKFKAIGSKTEGITSKVKKTARKSTGSTSNQRGSEESITKDKGPKGTTRKYANGSKVSIGNEEKLNNAVETDDKCDKEESTYGTIKENTKYNINRSKNKTVTSMDSPKVDKSTENPERSKTSKPNSNHTRESAQNCTKNQNSKNPVRKSNSRCQITNTKVLASNSRSTDSKFFEIFNQPDTSKCDEKTAMKVENQNDSTAKNEEKMVSSGRTEEKRVSIGSRRSRKLENPEKDTKNFNISTDIRNFFNRPSTGDSSIAENRLSPENDEKSHILSRNSLKVENSNSNLKTGHLASNLSRTILKTESLTPSGRFKCKLCPKSYDKYVSLKNHQSSHSTAEFPCQKCKRIFQTDRALKGHKCAICSTCGRQFKDYPHLLRHMTYVHTDQSNLQLFECDSCDKKFKYKVSMERHVVQHLEVTKNRRFECEICHKSFKRNMGLVQHKILHRSATLTCKVCGVWFKKKGPFLSHKCLICPHCPKQFSSSTKLNDHVRNMHVDVSLLSLYICDICGRTFKYRPSLVRHVLNHREVAAFKCEFCGKEWKSHMAMRDHIKLCHTTETVKCKICFKEMKPHCIYQHMKYVHTTDKNFSCEICGAAFKRIEKLKRHMDTHDRKFQCKFCERKFSSQYEVRQHEDWHKNPNIYQCKVCKKACTTKTSLNTHSKIHKVRTKHLQCPHCPFKTHLKGSIDYHLTTHEKREKMLKMKKNWFKCEICGALLKSKSTLWGHHRKVHSAERFECDLCGVKVKSSESFKHHFRTKHLMKEVDGEKKKRQRTVAV